MELQQLALKGLECGRWQNIRINAIDIENPKNYKVVHPTGPGLELIQSVRSLVSFVKAKGRLVRELSSKDKEVTPFSTPSNAWSSTWEIELCDSTIVRLCPPRVLKAPAGICFITFFDRSRTRLDE
ncbi:hypothetical protein CHS0354_016205 [Potamilus streckersoni]|uniref:Uncharacterized protein n=1 Tax=Potamilus streckersoni TaxID=2493646 RepID=A0AAE0RX72_9BIVA|nr:hypothetical protein CHS0354_016205 [Potamilus streckersoni]